MKHIEGLQVASFGTAVLAGLTFIACASATTLQRLSLDEMIQESSGIVRAKVTGSRAAWRGPSLYTYYQLQVLEAPKGPVQQNLEVAVTGGTADGVRQIAIGSPNLTIGSEYVIFLWTGKSGITQIIGLSQGLFRVTKEASGGIRLSQAAAEHMIDKAGQEVSDQAIVMTWAELKARIQKTLQKGHPK